MRNLATSLALLLSAPALAQAPFRSPGETRPELPEFEVPAPERGAILPPFPIPESPDLEGLSGGVRAYLREIQLTGNTALSSEELAEITGRYANQVVGFAELARLGDELTLAYVNRGYVSSGAVIPEQSLSDGVLEVQIVEGRLGAIEVETDGRLRESYVRGRLARGMRGPVNIHEIEERLQILQQDPRIGRIEAELVPGAERGESVLRVRVVEETPWRVLTEANNHRSPTIGSWGGRAEVEYRNLSGFGDSLLASFDGSEGLREVEGRYRIPLSAANTALELYARAAWSEVVEPPFDELGIESNTQTYGVSLEQPAYRTLATSVSFFLAGEWRRSKSFLLGSGFSFTDGPEEGESKLSVLRGGAEWVHSTSRQVLAARSTLSLGVDVLGATENGGGVPDGQFLAWLGQAQWARRVDLLASEVVARLDVQLSDRPLLGLEQFGIGGYSTVRGYRENALVRDDGLIGSLEARVPVLRRSTGAALIELAPFVDVGYSWNSDRGTRGPTTLASAGIGARLHPIDRVRLEIYWGAELLDVPDGGRDDAQNEGFHVGLAIEFP